MTEDERPVAYIAHGDGCLVVSGETVAEAKKRARDLAWLAPLAAWDDLCGAAATEAESSW